MKIFAFAAIALAAAPLAAAPRHDRTTAITVRMTDHGFVPRLINLRHGAPYVIRFVNASGRGHDFSAPDFFRAARVDPASLDRIRNDKIDLDPGQTATVRLIAPDGPGRFPFKSEHLADAASGLSGYVLIR